MITLTFDPRYRPAVQLQIPETPAEASSAFTCPVFACSLTGRACASRHLEGTVGHQARTTCSTCPAGTARAALLDVQAPTPADVLRQMTSPGRVARKEPPMSTPPPVSTDPQNTPESADAAVLAALRDGPLFSSVLRERTGFGQKRTEACTGRLIAAGKIERIGSTNKLRYALVGDTRPVSPRPPAAPQAPAHSPAPAQPKGDLAAQGVSAREAARRAMPLGGSDAQALEGALQITERERDAAREEAAGWQARAERALAEGQAAAAQLEARRIEVLDRSRSRADLVEAITRALGGDTDEPMHDENLVALARLTWQELLSAQKSIAARTTLDGDGIRLLLAALEAAGINPYNVEADAEADILERWEWDGDTDDVAAYVQESIASLVEKAHARGVADGQTNVHRVCRHIEAPHPRLWLVFSPGSAEPICVVAHTSDEAVDACWKLGGPLAGQGHAKAEVFAHTLSPAHWRDLAQRAADALYEREQHEGRGAELELLVRAVLGMSESEALDDEANGLPAALEEVRAARDALGAFDGEVMSAVAASRARAAEHARTELTASRDKWAVEAGRITYAWCELAELLTSQYVDPTPQAIKAVLAAAQKHVHQFEDTTATLRQSLVMLRSQAVEVMEARLQARLTDGQRAALKAAEPVVTV